MGGFNLKNLPWEGYLYFLEQHNLEVLTLYLLQLSSSIASFIWKPVHFEFRSYGNVCHKAKTAYVEKYPVIYMIFSHFKSYSIRKIDCVNVVWFGSVD